MCKYIEKIPIRIKLDAKVTYSEVLPSIRHISLWSCDHVMSGNKLKSFYLHFHETYMNLWSCGHMMSQDKLKIRSPLLQDLLPTNLTEWWLRVMASYPLSHMTFSLRIHMRLHDKLAALYLHFLKIYGHQTFNGQSLEWVTL